MKKKLLAITMSVILIVSLGSVFSASAAMTYPGWYQSICPGTGNDDTLGHYNNGSTNPNSQGWIGDDWYNTWSYRHRYVDGAKNGSNNIRLYTDHGLGRYTGIETDWGAYVCASVSYTASWVNIVSSCKNVSTGAELGSGKLERRINNPSAGERCYVTRNSLFNAPAARIKLFTTASCASTTSSSEYYISAALSKDNCVVI